MLRRLGVVIAFFMLWGTGAYAQSSASPSSSCSVSSSATLCKETTTTFTQPSVTFSPMCTVCGGHGFPAQTITVSPSVRVLTQQGDKRFVNFSINVNATRLVKRPRSVTASLSISPSAAVTAFSGIHPSTSIHFSVTDKVSKNSSPLLFVSVHISPAVAAQTTHQRTVAVALGIGTSSSVHAVTHVTPSTTLTFGATAFVSGGGTKNATGSAAILFTAAAKRALSANRGAAASVAFATSTTERMGWQKPDASSVGVSAVAAARVGLGRTVQQNMTFSAVAMVAVNGGTTHRRRGMVIGGM